MHNQSVHHFLLLAVLALLPSCMPDKSPLVSTSAPEETVSQCEECSNLFRACWSGHRLCVLSRLDKGDDANDRTPQDQYTRDMEHPLFIDSDLSPLDCAAQGRHLSIIQLLVERGADVNAQTEALNRTALHCACYGGDIACVQFLQERSAQRNPITSEGETLLHYACAGGDLDCVQFLLEQGFDMNARQGTFSPLDYAQYRDRPLCLQFLIERGADIKSHEFSFARYACYGNHAQLLQTLINCNLDLEAKECGHALLHYACKAGGDGCVELLLKHGADINARTAIRSYEDPFDYDDTHSNLSPLDCAAQGGRVSTMQLLINHEADVNAKTEDESRAALHWACYSGDIASVQFLLGRVADTNPVTQRGETLLHYACAGGHLDCIKFLWGYFFDHNPLTGEGNTLLHYACIGGSPDCVKFLLEQGADVVARNKYGKTALALADEGLYSMDPYPDHHACKRLLIAHGTQEDH